MKLVDIRPGEIYAVPLSLAGLEFKSRDYRGRMIGTAKDVSAGTYASPMRVIAIGKFRWQRQGACATVLAEDHYETTIHAEVLDIDRTVDGFDWRNPNAAPGHAGSKIDVKSKKLKWREVIVRATSVVMPWDAFKTRYSENQVAAMEMRAYQEKHRELMDELKTNIAVAVQGKFKMPMRPSVRLRADARKTFKEVEVTFSVTLPFNDNLTAKDKKLVDEILDIEERMSCQRMDQS